MPFCLLFLYRWFLVHDFLEVRWDLEFTCRLYGSNLSVEQADKFLVFFWDILPCIILQSNETPFKPHWLSSIHNIISGIFMTECSICWNFLFWESSSSLNIRCNLFFRFLSIEFFLIIPISCFLTVMTAPISDPSLFLWIWTIIRKYGSVIPLRKMIAHDCLKFIYLGFFWVLCKQLGSYLYKFSAFDDDVRR